MAHSRAGRGLQPCQVFRRAHGASRRPRARGRRPPASGVHSFTVSAIVLIGPAAALDLLRKQLASDQPVQLFTDHEVREAVEYIATARPELVAIDAEFAVSARGEALIGRIEEDATLRCQLKLLARGEHAAPPARKSGTGITPVGAPAPAPYEKHGTRRARRVRMPEGVAVTLDGSPAELVDLSSVGAQVVSKAVLRPNQRVRLLLPEGHRHLRCAGSVVWAAYEMPAGKPPRYRAGLKLSGVEGDALEGFAARHKAPGSGEPD